MNCVHCDDRLDRLPASRRWGGFTLVEVLVCLAIFAVSAVVLGASYVNLISNYHAAVRQESLQSDLSWLRRPLLTEADRAEVEKGGDATLPGGAQARWTAEIEETAVADLFQVTWQVEIDRGQGAPVVPIKQKFYLLRPSWSEPAEREKLRAETKKRLDDERSAQ